MADTNISRILRQRREQLNLTPREVVDKLKAKGISISEKTLYGYENGVGNPKVNTFIALCDIYDINDVMGTFTDSKSLCSTTSAEWEIDEYNDFFNAPLLEKIYLLIKWGIPSFSGYEERLSDLLPTDADQANFERLYSSFVKLNERAQGELIGRAELMTENNNNLKCPITSDESVG